MDIRRIFILQPQRGGRDRSQDFVLGEILKEVQQLRKEVKRMRQEIQAELDALRAEVSENTAADQAAITLLQGLSQKLEDALNSSEDPTEIVENIRSLTQQLSTDTDALAAAVTANTPAAPGGDATDPTDEPPVGGDEATDPTA